MPQNYSIGGKYVSKDRYEEFHGTASTKAVEVKEVVKKEEPKVAVKAKFSFKKKGK